MSSRGHENNQRHILSSFREISRRKTGCYRPIHPSIHHPSIRQYKLALAWDPGGLGIRAAYGGKTKHQFRMIQVLRKPAIQEKFSPAPAPAPAPTPKPATAPAPAPTPEN